MKNLKVIVVCSGTKGVVNNFVREQVNSLSGVGIDIKLYQINKSGLFGYLNNLSSLNKLITVFEPDLIHAHYGLSGLLSNLQRRIPVITTFHGSDINNRHVRMLSMLTHVLSSASVFVSEALRKKAGAVRRTFIIPCGVDLSFFKPSDEKPQFPQKIISTEARNVLFASSFSNPVKNSALALEACRQAELISGQKINLIELAGFTRLQVRQLINNVDCILITSVSEGSPQIVKEAMACNRPIVATKVGDIPDVIKGTDGCFLSSFDPGDVALKLISAFKFLDLNGFTNGRDQILNLRLSSESVAYQLLEVYSQVVGRINAVD